MLPNKWFCLFISLAFVDCSNKKVPNGGKNTDNKKLSHLPKGKDKNHITNDMTPLLAAEDTSQDPINNTTPSKNEDLPSHQTEFSLQENRKAPFQEGLLALLETLKMIQECPGMDQCINKNKFEALETEVNSQLEGLKSRNISEKVARETLSKQYFKATMAPSNLFPAITQSVRERVETADTINEGVKEDLLYGMWHALYNVSTNIDGNTFNKEDFKNYILDQTRPHIEHYLNKFSSIQGGK